MNAALLALVCSQAQQIHRLETQLYTDQLTQIGNRAAFEDALVAAWQAYLHQKQNAVLLYLDGNNIKTINDTYGHAAGDRVIVAIADSIRSFGPAFRLGGDEFALLLTGPHLATGIALQRLAYQIQHRILTAGRDLQAQFPIQTMLQGGRQLPLLSAAIGWATASQVSSATELKMKADAAMYVNKWRSKRLGRYALSAAASDGLRAAASAVGSTPKTLRC